ncbi:MAG: glycoside hydrolase family 2 TIM barrel-domain containing protein, partial [Oscillospiraceae bacterium]
KFFIDLEVEYFGYDEAVSDLNFEYSYNFTENDKIETSNNLVTDKLYVKKGYNIYKKTIPVKYIPNLWYPNGYGEQPLCDYSIKIFDNKITSDQISGKFAFRTLEFIHADGREDALPYSIVVNGKRVYIKGTNIVPLCHMQGNVDEKMLLNRFKALKECNVNYVRIWGGGHIESEAFYNKCDEYGIMVMQEFIMSSSGCDDVPSKNHHFLKMLHNVAVHNVKIKRNHVSLTTMDAGNELSNEKYLGSLDHEAHPATFEDSTVAMLKGVVNSLCPDIMFLPSSASGPNALLTQNDIGNNHDVHGPWVYMGVVDHYTLYNESDSILHSEFGCGGISNYSSLEKFLKKDDLKLCTSHTNNTWRHHSGGWDSYTLREQLMFG